MIEDSQGHGEQPTDQPNTGKKLAAELRGIIHRRSQTTSEKPPLDLNVHVFTEGKDNRLRQPDSKEAETSVVDYEASQRDRLLEQFPPAAEGLDLDRVKAFMAEVGLPLTSFTVIEPDQAPAMEAALAEAGIEGTGRTDIGVPEGISIPLIGFSYIKRNPEVEATNGPAVTESMLVHELAHMAGPAHAIAINREGQLGVDGRRRGFAVKVEADQSKERGVFFEEAFAELTRQRYTKEALGKPGGFGPEQATTIDFTITNQNGKTVVDEFPSTYLHKDAAGEWTFTVSAPAAAAIEALNQLNPDIIPLMYRARTDTDAYRDFIRAVNDIQPGLYSYLGKLSYNIEDFCTGLLHVQKLVKQGRSEGSVRDTISDPDDLTDYFMRAA